MIDFETEGKVIGSMCQNVECLEHGLTELKPEHFSRKEHASLFKTISTMYGNSEAVSLETVYEREKSLIKDNRISWTGMMNVFANINDFKSYTQKLKDLSKGRKMVEIAQKIINSVDSQEPVNEVVNYAENALYAVSTETQEEPIITPQEQAESILHVVADCMDKESRNKTSLYTGFKKLNYNTGGFEAGDLVIISGPTGGGKTAFAMNLAKDIAVIQKQPCLYINTEMSKKQMALRWAAILSKDWKVTNTALRMGEITSEQYSKLAGELDQLYKSEFYSITIPDLTVPKMLSTIRRFAIQKKVRAVTVDYIGRCDLSDSTKDDWQLLLNAARKLKTIAQQHNLVIFMLSQVDSQGKLAMAKYMQHEADLHLHVRPITDEEKKNSDWFWNYVISIEKGRSSPKGVIPVRFAGEKLTFISEAEVAKKHAQVVDEQPESGVNPVPNRQARSSNKGSGRRYDY